jgi:outer membrane usher protein
VFVRGVLRDAGGGPVALATGEVVAAGDPKRSPIPLLTNRAGRFAVAGLKPGRYEIRLAGSPAVAFQIPAGFAGVYSAGELKVASAAP